MTIKNTPPYISNSYFFFFLSDKIHKNNFCYDKIFMATFFSWNFFSVKYIYFTKKSPLMLWPCVESPSSHGYFFFFLSQNPRGANATGSFAQHSRLCDVHILINFSRPFLGLVYYVKKPEIIVLLHTQIHTYFYLCRRIRLFWPYFWHHK